MYVCVCVLVPIRGRVFLLPFSYLMPFVSFFLSRNPVVLIRQPRAPRLSGADPHQRRGSGDEATGHQAALTGVASRPLALMSRLSVQTNRLRCQRSETAVSRLRNSRMPLAK